MDRELESVKTKQPIRRSFRQRFTVRDELVLALLPTFVILLVFFLVEILSEQRFLFASLASSAFLIYLDPEHGTNRVKTLVVSQLLAASLGLLMFLLIGPPYLAGGMAMILTIVLMVLLDVVHPPAVSTALVFAFRAGGENNLVIFGLAVMVTATLVLLQRLMIWMMARFVSRG
jgi:CBS-domain-containing membrane protein